MTLLSFMRVTPKCKKHELALETLVVLITIKGDKDKKRYGTSIDYCCECYPDKTSKSFDEYIRQIAIGYMGWWNINAAPENLNIEFMKTSNYSKF